MSSHKALRRLTQSFRLPQPCVVGAVLTSSASLSSQTTSGTRATTTAATARRRTADAEVPHHSLVMDLGNNIKVEIPSRAESKRSKKRGTDYRKKQQRGRGNAMNDRRASAARDAMSVGDTVESKQVFGTHQDTTAAATSVPGTAPRVEAEVADAVLTGVMPRNEASTVPLSGAEAAKMLSGASLMAALATPASVPTFSFPVSPHRVASDEVEAARQLADAADANLKTLQSTALPLLFYAASQQQQQQQARGDVELAADGGSLEVDLQHVKEAVRILEVHLDNIQCATRRDGRRHVSALPPPVVAALWDRVMPYLHQQAVGDTTRRTVATDNEREKNEGLGSKLRNENAGDEEQGEPARGAWRASERDDADSLTNKSLSLSPQEVQEQEQKKNAPPPGLKALYASTRRALALHTRAIATLLPADHLSMVLTRMFQCGALADDVLGPIVSDWMEEQDGAARQNNKEMRAAAASTVGGSIAILQERVLRVHVNAVPSATDKETAAVEGRHNAAAFHGASAVTMARLLGKASIPGHHQLHRFFHLALLPAVTEVLAATATAATRALQSLEEETTRGSGEDAGKLPAGVGHTHSSSAVKTTTSSGDAENVRAALAALQLPGADALVDLTAAFRHYAVSGHAVEHLTTLWRVQLLANSYSLSPRWGDGCAALLTALSTLPMASAKSQRRHARQLPRSSSGVDGNEQGGGGGQRERRLLRVAEDDYYALVDVACAQLRQLSEQTTAASLAATSDTSLEPPLTTTTTTTATAAASSPSLSSSSSSSVTDLLRMLRMLLRVNSTTWAETYDALATAIFVRFTTQLHSSSSNGSNAESGDAASAPASLLWDVLQETFPLSEARRTVTALLQRNSLIPDHPLHRVLLRRLLYAPEALTDSAVAGTALLGLDVMIPADEGLVHHSDSPSQNEADEGETSVSAMANEQSAVTVASQQLSVVQPSDDVTVTAQDRRRALQLLKKFGRSVSPTAFVAGLCVSPIRELTLRQQTALVNYTTSIASAVSPTYLVKAMAALVTQLPAAAVDDVSVQQWYSRFTAVDVVRRVDSAACATLLDILSSNERYARNCAVAKQAITRRLGTTLLRSDGAGDGDDVVPTSASASDKGGRSSGGLTLAELPRVVLALRRANVFFPPYFSRVCRLLLGQVERASLGDLLVPFAATAEEYMRRHQREAQGSVFKDVWELLRGRVLEQGTTLSVEETCTALNAFAALDVGDRALFGVLVYQLWRCVQQELTATPERTRGRAMETAAQPPENKKDAASLYADAEDGDVQEVQLAGYSGALHPSAAEMDGDDANKRAYEEQMAESAAAAHRVALLGAYITRTLSPSAVAVVVSTLCSRDAGLSSSSSASASERGQDEMVRTMLPWMLLALRDCHRELYPVDVVHLLPVLATRYSASLTDANKADRAYEESERQLLHVAYDACRTTFLDMYAVLPAEAATEQQSAEGSTLTPEQQRHMAEQRALWTPAVKLSVQVVPGQWFATLLLALSSSGLADVDVGLACVSPACTRRVCNSQLSATELVDVCLTMCWLFRLADCTQASHVDCHLGEHTEHQKDVEDEEREENVATSAAPTTREEENDAAEKLDAVDHPDRALRLVNATAAAVLRPAMATVLSALWYRTDELTVSHIRALLRCLAATYGADRVDADFVTRLRTQEDLIMQRRKAAAGESASVVKEEGTKAASTTGEKGEQADAEVALAKSSQTQKPAASLPASPTNEMNADDLFSMM